MTLLVTGGAGYIGSVCVEVLTGHGYDVAVVDNLQEGHREAVPEGIPFYEGNYGDRDLLNRIFGECAIDGVLHFAADTKVEESMADPGKYFRNNVLHGIALLDAMRAHDCSRIIFSSTAATFGEPCYVPVDEGHPQVPVNPYGESKLMYERILEWYHRAHGIKYSALRYFNAAGASGRLGDAHRKITLLIPVVAQVLLGQRKTLSIFGNDYPTEDGTCVRDYIHVIDLAEAHVLALEKLDENPHSCYNLGNGKGFSNLQVVRTMEEVTGMKVPWEFAGRRAGDPAVLIASSERARKELDWNPRYNSLKAIVSSAWEWHRRHPEGYQI